VIWSDDATGSVFIATRHDLHAELAAASLRAGKHTFVEKPLAITIPQLEKVREAVEASSAPPILLIGLNRRFAPATKLVREFFGATTPLVTTFRFAVPVLPKDHWTHDEEVGGGRLVGEACHAIDTCVAITGSPIEEIHATSVGRSGGIETSDDRVIITMRHQNGSISTVTYVAGGDKGFPPERLEIFGGGKTAVINAWDDVELWSGGKMTKRSGEKDRGHGNEVATFLDASKTGRWPVPWSEIYNVSLATILALRSLRDGLPQRLSEAAPDAEEASA
jgi:predicted dehydrogenase